MQRKIVGGTVLTAADEFEADVVIEDGRITGIVKPGTGPADAETIDAKGCFVMPGGVDVHTHLDMPFGGTMTADDFQTGTIAAAHGGTTSFVDFAIQSRGQTLKQGLDTWHAKAEGKAAIDYGFHLAATDLPESELKAMADIADEGVTTFKLFMAYPGVLMLDDQQIFRAMLRAAEVGAMIQLHAEAGPPLDVLVEQRIAAGETDPIYHGLTRPEASEASGTERGLALAEMADAPVYIVHLTCKRALERVNEARSRGVKAYAETCPQYLFLDLDKLRGTEDNPFLGAGYVCSPPLRKSHPHQDYLWNGLKAGDLQVVATDHCSFRMAGQKDMGKGNFAKIPNGMPGIETRLHLMWSAVREGRISRNKFVDLVATSPAKLFGMYPQKGSLAIGADADIVLWDPEKKLELSHQNLHMNVDYSPYAGMTVTGAPKTVLLRGETIVSGDTFQSKAGSGQFLRRGRPQL